MCFSQEQWTLTQKSPKNNLTDLSNRYNQCTEKILCPLSCPTRCCTVQQYRDCAYSEQFNTHTETNSKSKEMF